MSSTNDEQRRAIMEQWPEKAAAHVKLLMPPSSSPSSKCRLRLDRQHEALLIVNEQQELLDVILLDDLVGANLQLHFRDDENSTNATAPPRRSQRDRQQDRASNEPPTDELFDRNGHAGLSLFVYARQHPAALASRIWAWFQLPPARVPQPDLLSELDAQHDNIGDRPKLPRIAAHRVLQLAPSEDLGAAHALARALQQLAHGRTRTEQYLVIVNPQSGAHKNGAALARHVLVPMLEQANIACTVVMTTHAKHCCELMMQHGDGGDHDSDPNKDVSEYDGLVLVGGDGIMHEAINGIMQRADAAHVLATLKIGLVGAGSCNGFTTSLAHEAGEKYGPVTDAYLIAKNQCQLADLSRYQLNDTTYYSFLTFTWAIIADVDIESECLRWLGETRIDLWAVLRCIFLRRYRAKLSWLPWKPDSSGVGSDKVAMPALDEALPANWKTLEDDILLLWVSHVSHAAMHTHQSPSSRMADGIMKLFVVRGHVSRWRLAYILLGLASGTHIQQQPHVELYDAQAFRLEPRTPGSFNDIDGEVVEDGPVQAHILPGAMKVFSKAMPMP